MQYVFFFLLGNNMKLLHSDLKKLKTVYETDFGTLDTSCDSPWIIGYHKGYDKWHVLELHFLFQLM